MAKLSLILVAVCQLLSLPILGSRSDDVSPLLDLASSFLQNMGDGGNSNGLGAIGDIVGTLMQGDGAKNLGALLGQTGNAGNGADLLSGESGLLTYIIYKDFWICPV